MSTGLDGAATTVVVDRCTYEVAVSERTARSARLRVTLDGRVLHDVEVAGWAPRACGIAAGEVYVWTARQVLTCPAPPAAPASLDVDEELLQVFRVDAAWVLVCETSLRWAGSAGERRLELGEVVRRAWWDDDALVVEDVDGSVLRCAVDAAGWSAQAW